MSWYRVGGVETNHPQHQVIEAGTKHRGLALDMLAPAAMIWVNASRYAIFPDGS